ncbi:MAG: MipA/OmpV family protein [Halioglobus sp.]|nr:MipA/OmpV family protein [Halioglobus sp.]
MIFNFVGRCYTPKCILIRLITICLAIAASPGNTQQGPGFSLAGNIGLRDIDFKLSNFTPGPIVLRSPAGELPSSLEIGQLDIELNDAIYTLGLGGSLFYERLFVTGLFEITPSNTTEVEVDSESAPELSEPRSSDLSRADYTVTIGYEVWEGLSVFSGLKFTEFEIDARENTTVILGSRDISYEEQGMFLGVGYTWHVAQRLSMSFSAAYAFLDIEMSDAGVSVDDIASNPITIGSFEFESPGRGLSVGWQSIIPITEHWIFGSSIKYQRYTSSGQTTELTAFTSSPGLTVDPFVVKDIDTDHTDVVLNFGIQYVF